MSKDDEYVYKNVLDWTEEECKALWKKYCESGEKPDDIPDNPDEVYADQWTSWKDFLGYVDTFNEKELS